MAYTKQNFIDDEILYADQLNKMEDQIVLNEAAINNIISTQNENIGVDTSVEIGDVEHLECCQRFMDEMNRVAANIGMTNSTFVTPSGLPIKPIYKDSKNLLNIEYNSYTTAYDLLLLLIAARHTPTALAVMGTESYDIKLNGENLNITHSVLESKWKTWALENNYTILGAKGGSLEGSYGEIGKSGIYNMALLVQDASGNTYGVTVVGLQNPSDFSDTTVYSTGDKVKFNGVTYESLKDNNMNNAITNTTYWVETISESDLARILVRDLIEMLCGASATTAINDAIKRPYPVGMSAVKLTADGDFDQDIEQLTKGVRVFYNKSQVRVAASVTKILHAIVTTSQFDNHYCTVNTDDMVGGSGLKILKNGDLITTYDALYGMMLKSDNVLATLLARDCGKRMSGATKEWVTNEIASVSGTVSETWVTDKIQTAVAQKADKEHKHTEYAENSHTHSISDITSGTLPLSQGGTGSGLDLINAPENAVIRKAGSGYESLFYTATGDGAYYATRENGTPKFGTLPIEQGGTGATTLAGVQENLGIPVMPTLTASQKKQIQNLADAYRNLNSQGVFMYYGPFTRNSYANNRCWLSEVDNEPINRFGLCCNTFVEMVWMGRNPIDFSGVNDGTEYSNKITLWEDTYGKMDWGYYPEFKRRSDIAGLARRNADGSLRNTDDTGNPVDTYFNFKQPYPDAENPYVNSYSTNTYYDPELKSAPYQWFASMQTQDELGLELYRNGYGIPIEELDVGDLIFTTLRAEAETENSRFVRDRTWRECGHVSLIYNKDDAGNLTIIECTDTLNKLTKPIFRSSVNMDDPFNRCRAEELLGNIVFCARHPAAWGHGNMDVTLHDDGEHYIDYQLMAYRDGEKNNAIPIDVDSETQTITANHGNAIDAANPLIKTAIQKGKHYVYNNNIYVAKKDADTAKFDNEHFESKWYNSAT